MMIQLKKIPLKQPSTQKKESRIQSQEFKTQFLGQGRKKKASENLNNKGYKLSSEDQAVLVYGRERRLSCGVSKTMRDTRKRERGRVNGIIGINNAKKRNNKVQERKKTPVKNIISGSAG